MNRTLKFWAGCLPLALLLGCAGGAMKVAEVGSYHVGGRSVSLVGLPERELVITAGAAPMILDRNGDFEVESLYARYTKLAEPRGSYPLLMWHGGGLSGVSFETKPDGQPGWENYFLHAGYSVYISDAVERGRASWARYPEIFKSEPFFRPKKEAWELFRIGPTGSYDVAATKRAALPGSQFPLDAFDQFAKQSIPRWGSNDAATQAAYDAYVDKACPCIVLVHSQGANFAFNAALKRPDLIKALVGVEPSGTPNADTTDFKRISGVPMLWVWGDYVDKYPLWTGIFDKQERFRLKLVDAGGVGDRIVLPEQQIFGNSHMLMMDRNSDQVAGLIDQWLLKHGLRK